MEIPIWLGIFLGLLTVLVLAHTFVLIGVVQIVHQGASGSTSRATAVGRPLPKVSLKATDDRSIHPAAFVGVRWALLFVSTDCTSCTVTVDELAALSAKVQERVVVVCRGSDTDCGRLSDGHAFPVVADADGSIRSSFNITSVPTAVIVDERGLIASEGQPERRELEDLVGDSEEPAMEAS